MSEFKVGDIVDYFDYGDMYCTGVVTSDAINLTVASASGDTYVIQRSSAHRSRKCAARMLESAEMLLADAVYNVKRIERVIQILKSKQQANDE